MSYNRHITGFLQSVIAAGAGDTYAVALYDNSADVNCNSKLDVDSDGLFYFAGQSGSAWTFLKFNPLDELSLEVITTLGSGLSAVSDIQVDSSGNIFVLDNTNNEVTKLNSAGTVQWGGNDPNISSQSTVNTLKMKLHGDQLFLAGYDDSSGKWIFEVDVTTPTSNAYGSRLSFSDNASAGGYERMYILPDTFNDRILFGSLPAFSNGYMSFWIWDKDQTGSASIADGALGGIAAALNTSYLGDYAHYDSLNNQYTYVIDAPSECEVVQLNVDGDTIVAKEVCTTIGEIVDSCMDDEGNIYLLDGNNEIIKLDDSLSPVWQVAASTDDGTLTLYSIFWNDGYLALMGKVNLAVNNDYCVFLPLPASSGQSSYTFQNPDDAPNTIEFSSITADSWSTGTSSLAGVSTHPQESTTTALNSNTATTTTTQGISTEITIG